uniref:Uncharacterized protein n=1 Tax=Lates calcarifer TaxID=8187 RepID=A0A4W6CAS0_LATCA
REGHLSGSCRALPSLGLFSIGTKLIISPPGWQFSTRVWVTWPIPSIDTGASPGVSFRTAIHEWTLCVPLTNSKTLKGRYFSMFNRRVFYLIIHI